MTLKKSTWFAIAFAALWGCDDAVAGGGGGTITNDAAAPVTRGDAAARDAAPPTVDCDEAPNGTPCGTPGSGKHCVLEACVENTCGDGIVVEEDSEECDDGNEDDGDGCSARCDEEPPDAGATRDASLDGATDGGGAPDASDDAGTSSDADTTTDTGSDASASGDAETHTGHDASTEPAEAGVTDAAADAAPHEHDAAAPQDAAPPQDAATDQDAAPRDAATAGDGSVAGSTCESCRDANCRAFQGVDLVAGCFTAVDGTFGATPDPNFIQDCIDTVACARQRGCGFGAQFQAADCYCGSNAGDVCNTTGPAADAKCRAEWQRATRTTANVDVMTRMSDLMYPSGWAYYLIDCYRVNCNSTPNGNCTVP